MCIYIFIDLFGEIFTYLLQLKIIYLKHELPWLDSASVTSDLKEPITF